MNATACSGMRALPSFEGLEAVEARFHRRRFSPHRHDDYVVGVTVSGVQQFRYQGEERRALPGEAFVLHPDVLHDGGPATIEGYGYRAVYVPPAYVAEALGGAPLPFLSSPISRDPRLIAAIGELVPDAANVRSGLGKTGAVALLADALAALEGRPAGTSPKKGYDVAKQIREHLMAISPGSVHLSDLETEHGIDRYALSRLFRRSFGVSPHRFIVLRRLDLTRRLIRSGASLAEAAVAAGFADQSHMTRHFRRAYGLSPGVWRRLQA